MAERGLEARTLWRGGGAALPITLAVLLAIALGLLAPGCLDRRTSDNHERELNRCTSCHGDPNREGDYLARSAPPTDLLGASDASSPGVGAHSIHLRAGATHAAVACKECHIVPDDVRSPGHADDERPAELVFGELSKTNQHEPVYDPAKRTCRGSYCHREARAVWTEPRTSDEACGSCHGLPPAAPHPQSARCSACHGEVIDAKRHFIAPERHVDGVVDVKGLDCPQCHGSASNAAPPLDTIGNRTASAVGVGAHQAHLDGGAFSRPLACAECHQVPKDADDPNHVTGSPARVTLTGVATSFGHVAAWDRQTATCSAWCHAPTPEAPLASPVWTADTSSSCTSCHGMPPAAPHPQMKDCSRCHGAVVGADNQSIIDKLHHVDGVVDVAFDQTCTGCHGSKNPAPPRDLVGNVLTTAASVGAHQTHVLGTASSRAVACAECHLVPKAVLDAGHVDTPLPAEVVFSGTALSFGGKTEYRAGRCESSGCHGAIFPQDHPSGGTNTEPVWTQVDAGQASCGSCHGLPPPPPHQLRTDCHTCHQNLAADDVTFTHPEQHVDGKVTFEVP